MVEVLECRKVLHSDGIYCFCFYHGRTWDLANTAALLVHVGRRRFNLVVTEASSFRG